MKKKPVILFGAGKSGEQLLDLLLKSTSYKVVGVIDDNPKLIGKKIHGKTIFSRNQLKKIIKKKKVLIIFFAIANLNFSKRKATLDWLNSFNIEIRTLPPISEFLECKVQLSAVRKINIQDILGRDEVPAEKKLLAKCIKNKTVLISGAGGSIGSELTKQVLKEKPTTLILVEQSEYALYKIEKEIINLSKDLHVNLISLLANILDQSRLEEIFTKFKPETVYHAAAYKHVPLVEQNIKEGVNTNTFGTKQIAMISARHQVRNFLLISTDKAVRPTNFMGASKRMAEMILQAFQKEYPKTIFTIVRFGNVLDSSGSVVPLFKEQIKNGGPVSVTHREINRYFMTISEAVSLVIQASGMSEGGEVFVLEMGKPIKIIELAKKMIHLSGFKVAKNDNDEGIKIIFTGLRPGEKLFEELLIGEKTQATQHPRILKATENYLKLDNLKSSLKIIKDCLNTNDFKALKEEMQKSISGFSHNSKIVDFFSE